MSDSFGALHLSIDGKIVFRAQGFFQQTAYTYNSFAGLGFRVACGPPVDDPGDPSSVKRKVGNSYTVDLKSTVVRLWSSTTRWPYRCPPYNPMRSRGLPEFDDEAPRQAPRGVPRGRPLCRREEPPPKPGAAQAPASAVRPGRAPDASAARLIDHLGGRADVPLHQPDPRQDACYINSLSRQARPAWATRLAPFTFDRREHVFRAQGFFQTASTVTRSRVGFPRRVRAALNDPGDPGVPKRQVGNAYTVELRSTGRPASGISRTS